MLNLPNKSETSNEVLNLVNFINSHPNKFKQIEVKTNKIKHFIGINHFNLWQIIRCENDEIEVETFIRKIFNNKSLYITDFIKTFSTEYQFLYVLTFNNLIFGLSFSNLFNDFKDDICIMSYNGYGSNMTESVFPRSLKLDIRKMVYKNLDEYSLIKIVNDFNSNSIFEEKLLSVYEQGIIFLSKQKNIKYIKMINIDNIKNNIIKLIKKINKKPIDDKLAYTPIVHKVLEIFKLVSSKYESKLYEQFIIDNYESILYLEHLRSSWNWNVFKPIIFLSYCDILLTYNKITYFDIIKYGISINHLTLDFSEKYPIFYNLLSLQENEYT